MTTTTDDQDLTPDPTLVLRGIPDWVPFLRAITIRRRGSVPQFLEGEKTRPIYGWHTEVNTRGRLVYYHDGLNDPPYCDDLMMPREAVLVSTLKARAAQQPHQPPNAGQQATSSPSPQGR